MVDEAPAHRYRAIWISDVHLGTRDCRAAELLDFLRSHDADVIYLVGDLIDGWVLRRTWHWPQAHNDVMQKLLRKVRRGARVVYTPGNHDEFARAYLNHQFGGIDVVDDAVHVTADGRRLWVVHGDRFDPVVSRHRWLIPVAHGFLALLRRVGIPTLWRMIRPLFGRPYRSLASFVKSRANLAMAALGDFERIAVAETRRRGLDGIVCGHVHVAAMRSIEGVLYANDGDWVDSCTALVEHDDGRLEIVRWPPVAARRRIVRAAGLALASEA